MTRWIRPSLKVATIDDVARLAGVSPATVSRVVNIDKNVRESTRQKVADAVRELNYVPNLAARSLARAGQVRLAVLCGQAGEAYLSAFLLGALEESAARGVELMLVRCEIGDGASEAAALARLRNGAINGVLLPQPDRSAWPFAELLRLAGMPVVAVGAAAAFCGVHVDDRAAAFEMTQHLLGLGHRRIGFVAGDPLQPSSAARALGFEQAMAQAGAQSILAQAGADFSQALRAAEHLLDQDPPPTAIFAGGDEMAAAVISVAQRRGLQAPHDLSVVGFDDSQAALTVWPALTTIRQPVGAMTSAAIALLLEIVQGEREGVALETRDRILPHELIRRESDGPPPAGDHRLGRPRRRAG